MGVQTQRITVEQFMRFIALPQNADRLFEYVGGEIAEVVTNYRASLIAARILGRMIAFVESKGLGYVSGEAGGYVVGEHRYLPDVAFISKTRQPEPPDVAYNPNPPDLAVEVLSPTDKPGRVRTKIANYLLAETVVWVVDPEAQEIEVYTPGKAPVTLGVDDSVYGGDVLPGFTLLVKDVFQI
jgi:Uma2 family endonuclease